jgi:hypothetical protein
LEREDVVRVKRNVLVLAAALAFPGAMFAGQATKKYDLAPGQGTVDVDVQVDHVRINQVAIKAEGEGSSPLKKSGSEAKVRMDNNGSGDVEAGAAIVLMDGAGNVVGAGSCGTKVGWLKAGERDTCSMDLGYVFRNLKSAKTLVVTLETNPKK